MYTNEQTKKLELETMRVLQLMRPESLDNGNGLFYRSNPSITVEILRRLLHFNEYRYYVLNDPLIADLEYDAMFSLLVSKEHENPNIITPDSPTQRVAKGLTKDFPTVQHLVPMLSLENSYNAEGLLDWDRKARDLGKTDAIEYCVEPKFDGASISLIYENDLLIRGATRGDGVAGDDITTNIKQIKSVPLAARFSEYDIQQIEIRGEVMLTKANFKTYNDQLAENGLPPLANPRNAAAGSLRIKDPGEVRRRKLEAFLYNVSYYTRSKEHNEKNDPLNTHSGSLEMLWNLGFRSPNKEKKIFKGIQGVIDYCHEFESKRDDLPYEVDGMVIKVNEIDLQEKLGMTTHHPRWAIAFKFKARQATTKLRGVEFQVGRTGAVTPVAKLDPVAIGGVTVSSISIHNEEYIKDKDLKIGDSVLIERAGDVIPQIVKSLAELRKGDEKTIHFPKVCPVCHSTLTKEEGEAVWRCINIECPAQVVERIIHFVSKDAMDIRSLGESNVRKFYELGLLKDIPSIYNLPFDKIRQMEGFGEKSITNLQSAIETSKTQPLHRLITALGIRYVGETTAKALAMHSTYLPALQEKSIEELQQLEDVGIKVATSIYHFFHNEDNLKMLRELEQAGVNLHNTKKKEIIEGNLNSQTFLFTGTLIKLKRSEAEEMVEKNGGKILSGVSSKLNYLVVGEDAGSKLEKAKKIPSVHIITEDEFLTLLTTK